MNLFYLLDAASTSSMCATMSPVMTILGYVILGIKIIVPIVLILYGMLDMAKAVMGKDDSAIKGAQKTLINRIIAAVLVYLIITIVTMVMSIVSSDTDLSVCMNCINNPYNCSIINETL